jgi:hypothetical protein
MITMRSLPPGAMGPAPHRNPHRHDAPQERPRRLRRAVSALARKASARRTRPVDVAVAVAAAES